jgi:protein associated with RNAse G/E
MELSWNLYRRRYLPDEIVHLKDDKILWNDDEVMITSWDTLRPRSDIKRGISGYFLKDGVKVSKIFNADDELVYWYCDIIRTEKKDHDIIFHDLLVDVILYPDGSIHVVDLDELGLLLKEGKIDTAFTAEALTLCDRLLSTIYKGDFQRYKDRINRFDQS